MYRRGPRFFRIRLLVSVCLTALAATLTHHNVLALPTGANLAISMKPVSGGMSGAAYTLPQEVSAAVFGNPAALTQFSGTQFDSHIVKIYLDAVRFWKHIEEKDDAEVIVHEVLKAG